MSLRRLLKRGLLSCGGYRVAQGLYARGEHRALFRKSCKLIEKGTLPLPKSVIFEATQRCNLNCRMCWQNRPELSRGRELTFLEIVDFFDRAPFLKKVTLTGGEIFLRRDIFDILEFLNRTRELVICTNGTLISGEALSRLQKFRRIYTVCISLDGDRSIHDAVRGVAGVFDRATKAIRALSATFPVTVNCVVQNHNFQYLPDFVTMCASLRANKIKLELERFCTTERIEKTVASTGCYRKRISVNTAVETRGYSAESLRQTLLECRRRAVNLGVHLDFDPFYLLDEIDACYNGTIRSNKKCTCRSFNTVTLTPAGDVVNCPMIREPFGNVVERRLEALWSSEPASSFRNHLLRHNLAALCENCPSLVPAAAGQ